MGPSPVLPIALAILNSLVQLGGVLFLGWPIGNIFLLLWIENVIITLLAILRMMGVSNAPDGGALQKVMISFGLLFFCGVHGVFTVILAFFTGLNLSVAAFLTPLLLLVVRYAVEAIGWYARGQRPATLSEAHGFAMRRIVMLHVAILICWAVMINGLTSAMGPGSFGDLTQRLSNYQLLALGLLLAVKTVAEVHAIRLGPNAPTGWKFQARR